VGIVKDQDLVEAADILGTSMKLILEIVTNEHSMYKTVKEISLIEKDRKNESLTPKAICQNTFVSPSRLLDIFTRLLEEERNKAIIYGMLKGPAEETNRGDVAYKAEEFAKVLSEIELKIQDVLNSGQQMLRKQDSTDRDDSPTRLPMELLKKSMQKISFKDILDKKTQEANHETPSLFQTSNDKFNSYKRESMEEIKEEFGVFGEVDCINSVYSVNSGGQKEKIGNGERDNIFEYESTNGEPLSQNFYSSM